LDDTAASLVALIELFAERTGRSVSTASRLATGSGDVVARLRRGADVCTALRRRTTSTLTSVTMLSSRSSRRSTASRRFATASSRSS